MVNRGVGEGNVAEALDKLSGAITELRSKIEEMNRSIIRIIEGQEEARKKELDLRPLDAMTLLGIRDHLRETVMVLLKRNAATAREVAEETGRARAVESSYLNQLVNLGYAKKKRDGRRVVFYIKNKAPEG